MKCIYCHGQTYPYKHSIIKHTAKCPGCNVVYKEIHNEIYSISIPLIEKDFTYNLSINIPHQYINFYRNGELIQTFPNLLWVFPTNIKFWIDKFNNLLAFI